jgi:hypothetical protein
VGACIGPSILPSAIVSGEDHNGIGSIRSDFIQNSADMIVELQHRVRVSSEARLSGKLRSRIVWVVHLHEVDIHEERLVVLGVFLDVVEREVSLPNIEGRQIVPVDIVALPRGFPGFSLPFVHVHDVKIFLLVFGVVGREPWVKPNRGVAVSVHSRIIRGERLHLIEAVLDWVSLGFVTEVPFAREVGRVAVLLEELRDGGRFLVKKFSSPGATTTESADRIGMRPVMNNAGPAVQLAAREQRPFLGHPIKIGGRVTKVRTTQISAEVGPAGIVAHQHDDVRPLLLLRSCL